MNTYNSKFLIFGNAKFYKKKGGNNHLISVIFSPILQNIYTTQ